MARQSTLARFEVSGEILGEDVVGQLTARECRLPGGQRAEKDLPTAWELLSEEWSLHRHHLSQYGTERLRRRWVVPFLETFGFSLEYQKAHTQFGDGQTIPITYYTDGGVPIWILEYGESPDEKKVTGRRNRSPHEIFQDYLDYSEEANWGILCNGKTIRLLHDYHKTLTRNYVEADLESIFDSLDVDAFRAVWRIFHADGFPADDKGTRPIEQLRDYSRQEGAEIGKELRLQVLEALKILGNGFLAADSSGSLIATLRDDPTEAPTKFYEALLRLVYRLLFLLYIENKEGWVPAVDPIWASSYSITRLREQAEQETSSRTSGEDHWEGLKVVFSMIRHGFMPTGNKPFTIHPYGGELFDDERLWLLADKSLRNSDILAAIRRLTSFERNKQPYRVNFRTLRIEALGSVYEGLLDVAPVITEDGLFDFGEGTDRKLSGSYYTPSSLVGELIKSALVPVIADKLRDTKTVQEKEDALLSVKVVDPACGSGHFLIAALDTLAATLCEIRSGGEDPDERAIRAARRDVVTHCIHGVDLRPMAVELCKFGLWLQVAHPELPLSYLEPIIKCGNSLIGVPLKKQTDAAEARIEVEKQRLKDGGNVKAAERLVYVGWPRSIPEAAFDPVASDSIERAKTVKKRNRTDLTGQMSLDAETVAITRKHLAAKYGKVLEIGEYTLEAIKRKDSVYREYLQSKDYGEAKLLADLWCAAFFWRMDTDSDSEVPTTEWLKRAQTNPASIAPSIAAGLARVVRIVRPFHWEIEFPDVFDRAEGGFDCVLGNPPWERIKLQEQEFFASRAPAIAKAKNKAERQQLIDALHDGNPALFATFQTAKHSAEAESKCVRKSGRFPLTAIGDVNTYPLFTETFRTLLSTRGRAGIIVPTGIATDDTTKVFFGDLVEKRSLESYFGFKNERFLFQKPVEHTVTFGLLTMLGDGLCSDSMEFCWLAYTVEDKEDTARRIVLSADDIALVNPNTLTCPVFRTRADAELTRSIYERIPVLIREEGNINPWGISFLRMFDMANDSGLFGPPHIHPVPLYEAKMFHQFDHRFATYEQGARTGGDADETRDATIVEKSDVCFVPKPRYLVERHEVWKKISRVPESLVNGMLAERVADVNKVLQTWFAGYCLNRGDEGDKGRAVLGEVLVQKMSMTLFGSSFSDAISYWANQAGCRALEQRYPLDEGDMAIVLKFAEDAIAQNTETVDVIALARDLVKRRCPNWFISFRDIARNTDIRTSIASILPFAGFAAHLMVPNEVLSPRQVSCYVANLNSIVFDFIVRHKVGGTHMNFFYVKQFPILPPTAYTEADIAYIAPRVLELTYTAHDMRSFAEEMGYDKEPFVWNEDRRAVLRAEIDAYYARLYGLTRKQLRYVLDPGGLSDAELANILDPAEDITCTGPHLLPANPTSTFPGETFRVLKNNDTVKYGEYRTRRLILEAWAELERELGPAPVRDYRELVTTVTQGTTPNKAIIGKMVTPAKPMVAEPTDLELVHPDAPPQQSLVFVEKGAPKSTILASDRPQVPPVGSRVIVNGRSGLLHAAEIEGMSIKARVLLDGESTPKSFFTPPALIEQEA